MKKPKKEEPTVLVKKTAKRRLDESKEFVEDDPRAHAIISSTRDGVLEQRIRYATGATVLILLYLL